MKIIYTDYAEDTIKDRKFSKEIIEDALKNPDEIVKGKRNRKIAHKIIKNKLLRVVFEENENAKTYIVITAYYAGPKRYMKNENQF
ncbi:DUF4258 domain-containing protein [Candidatus Pacearchaeota archaeon]|nr:DUF4258 domain-containing protein [Candidatus Pacearchaeota archaeon]